MSNTNNMPPTRDDSDSDIPVLTDIINEEHTASTPEAVWTSMSERTEMTDPAAGAASGVFANASPDLHAAASLPSLEQIEAELSSRLTAELALQIPVLLEAALREHLPKAIGAKLQAELVSALANALPGAARNAAAELSSTLAFEVGGLLEQRLHNEVRRAVSDEIARLSDEQRPSR